jgi:hypothetical protein
MRTSHKNLTTAIGRCLQLRYIRCVTNKQNVNKFSRPLFTACLLMVLAVLSARRVSAAEPETLSMSQIEERLLKLEASVKPQDPDKLWHEKISIRGYIQMRYNRLFENNEDLKCEQCDKSMGAGGGFYLRRARLVISGDVHDRVYLYMQADFANDVSATAQHFAQLRDLYADVALDPLKDYRIRMGLSKVIYGFENLQSSQNRLSLDRNDALNSAVAGERDLGVYFFWAPEEVRKRFAALVASGLKGSGDYGVVGVGAYNGQTANKPEANDSQHVAVRLAYPFRTDEGQYIEVGAQGYTGRAVVTSANSAPLHISVIFFDLV